MKIEIETTHKTAFWRTIILVIKLYSAKIIAQNFCIQILMMQQVTDLSLPVCEAKWKEYISD